MQSCNMPWGLRKRILRYVEYVSKIEAQNSEKDVQEVLGLLSPNLQTEVLLHVHRETIKEVAFFKNKTQDFVAKCVSKFKPLKVAEDEALAESYGDIANESKSVDDEIDKALSSGTAEVQASDSLAALKAKMAANKKEGDA